MLGLAVRNLTEPRPYRYAFVLECSGCEERVPVSTTEAGLLFELRHEGGDHLVVAYRRLRWWERWLHWERR